MLTEIYGNSEPLASRAVNPRPPPPAPDLVPTAGNCLPAQGGGGAWGQSAEKSTAGPRCTRAHGVGVPASALPIGLPSRASPGCCLWVQGTGCSGDKLGAGAPPSASRGEETRDARLAGFWVPCCPLATGGARKMLSPAAHVVITWGTECSPA